MKIGAQTEIENRCIYAYAHSRMYVQSCACGYAALQQDGQIVSDWECPASQSLTYGAVAPDLHQMCFWDKHCETQWCGSVTRRMMLSVRGGQVSNSETLGLFRHHQVQFFCHSLHSHHTWRLGSAHKRTHTHTSLGLVSVVLPSYGPLTEKLCLTFLK